VNVILQQNALRRRIAERSPPSAGLRHGAGRDHPADVFRFKPGRLRRPGRSWWAASVATGFVPKFYDDLQQRGIAVDMEIFREEG